MKIGESLRKLRVEKGITQLKLAEIMNISRVNYNRYENNVNCPSVELLCQLADFYDVTLDEMVGRKYGA